MNASIPMTEGAQQVAWRSEPFNLNPIAWQEIYSEAGPIICFDESERVVDVVACAFGETAERRQERADLISAAPELLEALQPLAALSWIGSLPDDHEFAGGITVRDIRRARAAIAKALGHD